MRDFLEKHKVILETIEPVFIGSGKSLRKKEYAIDKQSKKAWFFDEIKLYEYFSERKMLDKYEKYLIEETKPFEAWLKENRIYEKDYSNISKYSLSCRDVADLNTVKDILLFQKDAYGNPYIPGSSLKGALRTVLAAGYINNNPAEFDSDEQKIRSEASNYNYKNRKLYLSREIKNIESIVFNKKRRDEKNRNSAVNDIMSGLRISDSDQLSINDLTICQKTDIDPKGKEHDLPIVRECLKPGTKIEFELTIDNTECEYITVEKIRESIESFLENYNKEFAGKFKDFKNHQKDVIYIGGGSGYATKALTYQLFSGTEAVKLTGEIINNTLPRTIQSKHKHDKDASEWKVSPHMIKYAQFEGDLDEMGACKITIV